jgi:hypothetical protein
MIQLHPDCLLFQMPGGEAIPCSAEMVTVELIGDSAKHVDPDLVRNATRAVLHYFRVELKKNFVSMEEFLQTLTTVLGRFGLELKLVHSSPAPPRAAESDLWRLACDSGKSFELAFFPRLRDELRQKLRQSPHLVRFQGLRSCVKQLAGAQRWSHRCQQLHDQIVEYLRHCLSSEQRARNCSLVVR